MQSFTGPRTNRPSENQRYSGAAAAAASGSRETNDWQKVGHKAGPVPITRPVGQSAYVVRGQGARPIGQPTQVVRGQGARPVSGYPSPGMRHQTSATKKRAQKKEAPLERPLIYKTSIPQQLFEALMGTIYSVIVLMAPTGFGKTVMANATMAEIQKKRSLEGVAVTCTSIMPFRVSVIEMHEYLNKLFPDYIFGYAMRGDHQTSPIDNGRLNTVGYWLERIMTEFREHGLPKTPQIVMVDEAHDATWQTDLALRLLLWMQKQGADIKIVVTSATLDIANTLRSANINPLILTVEDEKANVEIKFLDSRIRAEDRGKLTPELFGTITKKLIEIAETSDEGDILIMLPGQDEITGLIEDLEKNKRFSDFVILPLYSAMTKDDIQLAIKPDKDGKRKIIVSTNVVENAITIDNLMYVIDCGYRKVSEIDGDGVQQLVLRPAARSNMKQALGRVGRQGKRGTAYLMLTEQEFDWRQGFSENEVQRNPLYLQIIKLIRDGLPVKEVLCHIAHYRIDNDTEFLIVHGALEKLTDGKIVVTDLGKIMAQLPLSIRAAHFLAIAVTTLSPSLWYAAAVASAWMDNGSSVFFRPGRKPREDASEYDARVQQVQDAQEEFFEKDCLTTMLAVWYSSWTIPASYKGGFHGWCKDKGIFDRTLKDIGSAVNHIIGSLENLKFNIEVPSQELCGQLVKDVGAIVSGLIPALEVSYKDWIFFEQHNGDYCREGSMFGGPKYSIDKFLRNGSIITGERPRCVMALALKRVSPARIIMSNLVNLPSPTPVYDDSDDDQYY